MSVVMRHVRPAIKKLSSKLEIVVDFTELDLGLVILSNVPTSCFFATQYQSSRILLFAFLEIVKSAVHRFDFVLVINNRSSFVHEPGGVSTCS